MVVVVVGPSWAHVGRAWPYVRSWAHAGLASPYVKLRPMLAHLGPVLGHLGPC